MILSNLDIFDLYLKHQLWPLTFSLSMNQIYINAMKKTLI